MATERRAEVRWQGSLLEGSGTIESTTSGAFGELGVSILVAPPGDATLPIRVYTMIANAPSSHVAVFALLQTTVVLTAVAVLGILASSLRVR